MSTAWRRWASNDPRALIEYVQRRRQGESTRGTPADLLGTSMPAPGVGPPMTRARSLYEAFAARGIQYADEPTTSDPGRQTVRPPDQVLSRPRHGTCLDLAVVFAGACLDAGLHPVIIVLAGTRPGDPAHALVAVWLDGNWSNRAHRDYRSDEHDPDWTTLPPDFIDQLVDDEDSPGAFLALDVTGVASRIDAGDPRRQEQQSWARSVAYGAELLRESAEDRWKVTIDVGLGYAHIEPHPLPYRPGTDVLAPPYLPVPQDNSDSGPLKLLWARHDAIHFHPRDELDFLRDWFQAPDPLGPRTRIALLHGVGGAGKTRLAAELAHQLAGTNWYAGFLVRDPDPRDRAWLSEVASPLLVVVDYVEDRKSADVINVLRTLREREAPTCLLLTARTVSGWWEEEIAVALKEDGHPYVLHDSELAARHPRQTGVYRAALRSFGGSQTAAMGHRPPPDPYSGRWTTLDLVMLAWLAVQSGDAGGVPESEEKLYEKILEHELGYWVRTYTSQIGKPSKRTKGILREAGACLSLLAPQEERLDHSLKAIRELADEGKRRDEIAALFADLLPSAPEDGTLAVRPDPLGSHLASSVFGTDRALLRDCLKAADEDEQLNACVSVSRFSSAGDGSTAADLAQAALNTVPDLWRPALSVAAAQGGVFVQALEQLAAAEGTPLPLAELAATVPTGHSTLRGLALIATECSKPDDADDASEEARAARAVWLNNLSVRQSETGDRDAALTSITEAVQLYRALAQTNPAAFLPNLAASLNNLSNQQSDSGDRDAALTSITEAVQLYRALAQTNPAAFLPNLAGSLNNLSVQQSNTGDRNAALTSITEAVQLHRTLAQADPAAFLPDLATSLNNLSNRQSDTGDRDAALTSITEAVHIRRTLAQTDPAAFLPNLAGSLNNLSVQQGNTGDRDAALTSITEAVQLYRTLAQTNPAAFLPHLAASLDNLSDQQHERQHVGEALRISDPAISELPSGPRAELLVSRAQWRHSHDDQAGAAADLLSAAQCADETTDPAWAGRSRRAVRSLVETLGQDALWGHSPDQDPPNLPAWVRGELSSETTDQLNEWLSASSWTEQSTFVRQNYLLLAAPDGRDALALARVLFPEATGLSDLADVLDAAAERGLGQVLEELRDFHTRADLVSEWLATPTWPDDLEFLDRHTQLTDDPLVRELLASQSHDPASRQHLAILQLTDHLAAPDVYDAVTDPSTANDTAMTFIGAGQPEALYPLFLAAPALLRMPFVTPYLFAVHTLFDTTTTGSPPSEADSDTPSPIELITEAATQASEVQRGAGAARLRRLAEHRPEHADALLQLATLLTSAAPAPGSDGG
ncbi:hypothetical protein ACGFNX_03830 [Streptomyces sp. NPDC048723]|uniref:hypothetical protein n=1 Tax=Streptomyces sp. NPDC048723 TaxID=3365589 RepID=UPI0037119C58